MYIRTNLAGEAAIRINSSTCPSAERGNSSLLICPPSFPLIVINAFLASSLSPSDPGFYSQISISQATPFSGSILQVDRE
jgi:hypothetical protein